MIDLNAVHQGDCLEVMKEWPDNIIDSAITDPPYGLSEQPDMVEVLTHWLAGDDYKHRGSGFMGKSWDSFVPGPATWREVYRVLKPGATLLCFAGQRTQDLMGVSLRLAGFEIFDCIMWVFGQGFGKGINVSKAIDKAAGAEREVVGHKPIAYPDSDAWGTPNSNSSNYTFEGNVYGDSSKKFDTGHGQGTPITAPATPEAALFDGYGSQIKPAYEPILCARKPNDGTFAQNALAHGVSGLNIDGVRVETSDNLNGGTYSGNVNATGHNGWGMANKLTPDQFNQPQGRYPPNLLLECNCGAGQGGKHAPDCVCGMLDADSGERASGTEPGTLKPGVGIWGNGNGQTKTDRRAANSGGASRFFPNLPPDAARFKYSPKAPQAERQFTSHETQKPLALMRWLCRLTRAPSGGIVLDPFAGSGTTLEAAHLEGRPYIGIEKDATYYQDILERLAHIKCEPYERPMGLEKKDEIRQLKLW